MSMCIMHINVYIILYVEYLGDEICFSIYCFRDILFDVANVYIMLYVYNRWVMKYASLPTVFEYCKLRMTEGL